MTGIDKMKAARERQPHGVNRYRAGCRCKKCCEAKRAYRTQRDAARARGETNGIVSAARSREHLLLLQTEHSVTVDAVALAAGLPRQRLIRIRTEKQSNVREETERLILGVGRTAALHNALVPAGFTRNRLEALKRLGVSQREIGRRLGRSHQAQIGRRPCVRRETARQVMQLFRDVVKAGPNFEIGV